MGRRPLLDPPPTQDARAGDRRELEALVLDVLVEQAADLLGLEPKAVAPDYGSRTDRALLYAFWTALLARSPRNDPW